uniref:Uncharacterized protein n=1 Tax=Rhodosorus marinus TaxID=101924 RepID=A0A7S3ACS5_9RHOD|mmetsp:Transcript_9510/g.41096  ORF Transcript_9510/g.41096 Transcript_9510/m.41096 type:complete len:246 (+) Transcript_9510:594-1331(+)
MNSLLRRGTRGFPSRRFSTGKVTQVTEKYDEPIALYTCGDVLIPLRWGIMGVCAVTGAAVLSQRRLPTSDEIQSFHDKGVIKSVQKTYGWISDPEDEIVSFRPSPGTLLLLAVSLLFTALGRANRKTVRSLYLVPGGRRYSLRLETFDFFMRRTNVEIVPMERLDSNLDLVTSKARAAPFWGLNLKLPKVQYVVSRNKPRLWNEPLMKSLVLGERELERKLRETSTGVAPVSDAAHHEQSVRPTS